MRSTTDATGAVTSDADYDTYGRPRAITDSPSSHVTRFGYAGEYTDPTGYLYLRARYYDPATAQFLTRDPLEATTGNPYGYTDGNPLQHTDPLGLDWLQDAADWSAAFGDTPTFGGTRQIRRIVNYAAWGATDDMVDNCSLFYQWGGYGGQVANIGLAAIGFAQVAAVLVQRIAYANQMASGALTARFVSSSAASASEGTAAAAAKLVQAPPEPAGLHIGQQGKHIPGHKHFIPGRGTITVDTDTLAARAGTGTPANGHPPFGADYRERVVFDEIIGTYTNTRTGVTDVPTNVGIYHYNSKGQFTWSRERRSRDP